MSVPTFGLSTAFIRARPITFLPAVLFIRWSEINCVGLERDYKGRCLLLLSFAPFIPRLFEYILKTYLGYGCSLFERACEFSGENVRTREVRVIYASADNL